MAKSSVKSIQTRRTWLSHVVRTGIAGVVSVTCLSTLPAQDFGAPLRSQALQYRTVSSVRDRISKPDYFPSRLKSANCVVYGNLRNEDSHWVAEHVEATWEAMTAMVDPWTTLHKPEQDARYPRYEVGPISVYVDRQPLGNRADRASTLHIVGNGTMIYLNVSEGQLSLEEQVGRLKLATAHAFLHESTISERMPQWVNDGLAGYVAQQELTPEEQETVVKNDELLPRFQGENRRNPSEPWGPTLSETPDDISIARIRYALEGNDAMHVHSFFDALAVTADRQGRQIASKIKTRDSWITQNNVEGPTRVDQFWEGQDQASFDAWRKDPRDGQPLVDPATRVDPQMKDRLLDMLVILKLAKRPTNQVSTQGTIRTVVHEFRNGQSVEIPQRRKEPVQSYSLVRRRLSDPTAEPWATLDGDGKLLLSSDTDRVNELLDRTYQSVVREGKLVLRYKWDRNHVLEGWLEENTDLPSRPLAKFSVMQDNG
jgi:hypothetical protein